MRKPCGKCGSTERNASGGCVPCGCARSAAWYEAHKNQPQLKAAKRSWYEANKDLVNAQGKAWAEAHPDAYEETVERSRLKKYGITPEQHQAMLERQGGLCCICREAFGRRIHIDHDHTTGVVRGLLCHRCNVGLGHFRDRPELLRQAAVYLEDHAPTDLVVTIRRPEFRPGDGRYKVTDAIRTEVHRLRAQGLSLGSVAKEVGLSRSWVQIILKTGGGPSITTS